MLRARVSAATAAPQPKPSPGPHREQAAPRKSVMGPPVRSRPWPADAVLTLTRCGCAPAASPVASSSSASRPSPSAGSGVRTRASSWLAPAPAVGARTNRSHVPETPWRGPPPAKRASAEKHDRLRMRAPGAAAQIAAVTRFWVVQHRRGRGCAKPIIFRGRGPAPCISSPRNHRPACPPRKSAPASPPHAGPLAFGSAGFTRSGRFGGSLRSHPLCGSPPRSRFIAGGGKMQPAPFRKKSSVGAAAPRPPQKQPQQHSRGLNWRREAAPATHGHQQESTPHAAQPQRGIAVPQKKSIAIARPLSRAAT